MYLEPVFFKSHLWLARCSYLLSLFPFACCHFCSHKSSLSPVVLEPTFPGSIKYFIDQLSLAYLRSHISSTGPVKGRPGYYIRHTTKEWSPHVQVKMKIKHNMNRQDSMSAIKPSFPIEEFFNENCLDLHQGTEFKRTIKNFIKECKEFKKIQILS